jgi:tripartite-type tricarboxylate transporter receptor subunit TctC
MSSTADSWNFLNTQETTMKMKCVFPRSVKFSTIRFGRREAVNLLLGLGVAFSTLSAAAQQTDYPNKPIRIVVAYAPGGSTDVIGRMFAQELSQKLGQSVIVENRAGGGTLLGTDLVIRAPADGYTLLFGTPATVISPLLRKNPPYDAVKDLQAVSLATVQSMGVLVSPATGIRSIPDLIKYAKANPRKLNFASSGNGSAQHLAAESLSAEAGIEMTHVPYKGAGQALNDLLSGQVQVMITSLVGSMTEQVKQGNLTLIATTGPERTSALPLIPSVAEGGAPNFGIQTFTALFGPPGLPKDVLMRLNAAMNEIQSDGVVHKKIASQAMDVKVSTPKELSAMMEKESKFYGAIIKRTGAGID